MGRVEKEWSQVQAQLLVASLLHWPLPFMHYYLTTGEDLGLCSSQRYAQNKELLDTAETLYDKLLHMASQILTGTNTHFRHTLPYPYPFLAPPGASGFSLVSWTAFPPEENARTV